MLYMQHFMSKISAKNVFIIIKTCSASGGRPLNYLPQLFNFPLDPRGLEETLLFTKAKPMPLTKNSVDATVERHRKFSSTIYSFSILCLEHHYCGNQQRHSLTSKLNLPSAFVYFRWSWSSWSCYFVLGLGLKNLVLFTSLIHVITKI